MEVYSVKEEIRKISDENIGGFEGQVQEIFSDIVENNLFLKDAGEELEQKLTLSEFSFGE